MSDDMRERYSGPGCGPDLEEWDCESGECTACGTGVAEFLDPRPRHPSEPQGQYCRECAADKFDISDMPGGAS